MPSDHPAALVEPPTDPRHYAPVSAPGIPVRHLRLPELQQIVPYTNVHLHRLEKAGRFPKRIRLGPARVVWRLDEVLKWVEARCAESRP